LILIILKTKNLSIKVLGIVPRETVHYLCCQILRLKKIGLFITFDDEFRVVFDDDFCKFGHIEIDLNGDDFDEDDHNWLDN
jgi:hypothetical protein